jgi:pimeloyl-ACP methyl ester carboxylesterase
MREITPVRPEKYTPAHGARGRTVCVKALDLRRVDLLGFSLGGFVAQQVALENPGLIRRLVLAGTGPQGGEGMDALTPLVTERATRDTPVMEDFLYLFFSPSETSQAAGRDFWERRHTRADQDIPSSIAAMHAQAAAITQWGAVPNAGRYSQLKRIKQPVLIVNGNEDIMVPSINSFILQQHIPNATLILYPDSGQSAWASRSPFAANAATRLATVSRTMSG